MRLDDEDVKVLVVAIVRRAALDYHIARKYMHDLGRHRIQLLTDEYLEQERMLKDCERFFTSSWFYLMGGSPAMWKRLRRECDRGIFRKEER